MNFLDKLATKLSRETASSKPLEQIAKYREGTEELEKITTTSVVEVSDSGVSATASYKVKEHLGAEDIVDISEIISSERQSLGDRLSRHDITRSYNDILSTSKAVDAITRIDINDEEIIGKKMPFMNQRMDFGSWVYKNRYGVISTMLIYIFLLLGIQFFTLNVSSPDLVAGIMINLEQMEEIMEDEVEKLKEENKALEEEQQDLSEQMAVENKLLDEYFEKQMEDAVAQPEAEEAEELPQEAEADEREMSELEKILARNHANFISRTKNINKEKPKSKIARTNVNKAGNVTVSVSLAGRYVTKPEVPAYLCRGGGRVEVEIVVDRNGEVLDATIFSAKQVSDQCLLTRSLEAARLTLFNVDKNAPKRQRGLITFQFVAQ